MSITDKLKESYKRMKIRATHPSLMATKGLESIIGFTTPIAAVLTVGAEPSYSIPQKILYGPLQVSKGIYESIAAYISNTGVRDYVNGTLGEIFTLIGNAAQNIAEKPVETAATILGAYALGKMVQRTAKVMRESKEDEYLALMD